jgi:hypothetical protein
MQSAVVPRSSSVAPAAWVRRRFAGCVLRGAKVVIADLADDKGKELASELDARYVRTDAANTDDVQAALAEAESLAPLRISVDPRGGPAAAISAEVAVSSSSVAPAQQSPPNATLA